MRWKKREEELRKLRQKHGRDRSLARNFPDLSVEHRPGVASLSNRMGPPGLKKRTLQAILGPSFVVEHIHKSGYQVFSVRDLSWLGGKKT
jgi:hypothetical protein